MRQTVGEYNHAFGILVARIPEASEIEKISYYADGLQPYIREAVLRARHRTVMYRLAA